MRHLPYIAPMKVSQRSLIEPGTQNALLGAAEAANFLGISRQSLYNWMHLSRLPTVRIGRWLRFRVNDLERFVANEPMGPIASVVYDAPIPAHLEPGAANNLSALRKAIRRSGKSDRQFALQVLGRDERTLRRWLAGESPIPSVVLKTLK